MAIQGPSISFIKFFNMKSEASMVTQFLDPNDLGKMARVSKIFCTLAYYQFTLLTKLKKKLEKPSLSFKMQPRIREHYVCFDDLGVNHISMLFYTKLRGYTLASRISKYFTATQINKILNHLYSELRKTDFVIQLPLISFEKKLALENGRKLIELEGLEDYQAELLKHRKDLNKNDVLELEIHHSLVLKIRKDLKSDDVKGLKFFQTKLLMFRLDISGEEAKSLSKIKAEILRVRKNVLIKQLNSLKNYQLEVLLYTGEFNVNNVITLSEYEANGIIAAAKSRKKNLYSYSSFYRRARLTNSLS